MDSLTGYVATGLVMLIVGLLLRELEPKVKVVWWSPHQFQFQLPQPPNILLTHAITIQGYPGTTAGPGGAGEPSFEGDGSRGRGFMVQEMRRTFLRRSEYEKV
jgi:hypothetical protein